MVNSIREVRRTSLNFPRWINYTTLLPNADTRTPSAGVTNASSTVLFRERQRQGKGQQRGSLANIAENPHGFQAAQQEPTRGSEKWVWLIMSLRWGSTGERMWAFQSERWAFRDPTASCNRTLSKLLHLHGPQFLHLLEGDSNRSVTHIVWTEWNPAGKALAQY